MRTGRVCIHCRTYTQKNIYLLPNRTRTVFIAKTIADVGYTNSTESNANPLAFKQARNKNRDPDSFRKLSNSLRIVVEICIGIVEYVSESLGSGSSSAGCAVLFFVLFLPDRGE